jgi:hypothetical protein
MKTLHQVLMGSARAGVELRETYDNPSAGWMIEADLNSTSPNAKVILLAEGPGNKAHNHYYGADLLEKSVAAGLFEGKPSFLNHPTRLEMQHQPERSVDRLAGWFSETHIEKRPVTEAGLPGMPIGYQRSFVVGKLNAESGNALSMGKLREAANYQKTYPDKPGYVGWSILGGGTTKPKTIEGHEFSNVESFTDIDSIDMVTKAGAGGRLISLMEGQPRMFRNLFGKQKTASNGAVAEQARLDLAAHVVSALKESGTTPTADQTETIQEGIKLLDPQLMTPAFIRTLIHEADIDIPDDKETKFSEALDPEGKFKNLREAASKTPDPDETEEAKKTREAKEAADKAKATQEADRIAREAGADKPETLQLIQRLSEENGRLKSENTSLKETSEQSVRQVRESSARTLMAKTTISAPKQAVFLESISELPIEQQASKVAALEEAFGDKVVETGNPARVSGTRGTASGARFAVDATR